MMDPKGRASELRLVFAVGSWQILTAVTALGTHDESRCGKTRDVLVIYGRGIRPPDVVVLEALGRKLWTWEAVVNATDLLTQERLAAEGVDEVSEALRNLLGVRQAHDAWVCKIENALEKTIIDAFSPRNAYLFEDGLETYLFKKRSCGSQDGVFRDPRRWAVNVAHRFGYRGVRRCLGRSGICQRIANNFKGVYLNYLGLIPLPDHLQALPTHAVGFERIHDAIARARDLPAYQEFLSTLSSSGPGLFLLLGQPFSDWKFLSPDQEREVYVAAASRIVREGYRVMWKEHPRTATPLGPTLKSLFGDQVVCLEGTTGFWPVEMMQEHFHFGGCAALTSTALINLRGLYDIPCYTIERSILRWPNDKLRHQAELIRLAVEPIEAMRGPTGA